jgi:hypothetical protein
MGESAESRRCPKITPSVAASPSEIEQVESWNVHYSGILLALELVS